MPIQTRTRPPGTLAAIDPRALALTPSDLDEIDAALATAASVAASDSASTVGEGSRELFALATRRREIARRIRSYLDTLPREAFK